MKRASRPRIASLDLVSDDDPKPVKPLLKSRVSASGTSQAKVKQSAYGIHSSSSVISHLVLIRMFLADGQVDAVLGKYIKSDFHVDLGTIQQVDSFSPGAMVPLNERLTKAQRDHAVNSLRKDNREVVRQVNFLRKSAGATRQSIVDQIRSYLLVVDLLFARLLAQESWIEELDGMKVIDEDDAASDFEDERPNKKAKYDDENWWM